MNNLSPHGFRAADEPSRRGFLITMMGAGVMLGYARRSLADQSTGSARRTVSNRRSGMGSTAAER